MSTRIRKLEMRDRPLWEILFRGYIEFYRAIVPDQVIDATFARLLQSNDLVCILAVDEEDAPVGLAHLLFHASTWSSSGYCYLEDLFVDPTMRRTGIGRLLIEAAEREAHARSATRLYWVTQTTNSDARRLYDSVADLAPFVQYRKSLASLSASAASKD